MSDVAQWQFDALEHYKISDWDDSTDTVYLGFVGRGTKYYLMKINTATNNVTWYYDADSTYAVAWAARAGLTFGQYKDMIKFG